MEPEIDNNGAVTFLPMIEWGVWVVEGRTVGVGADYYASPADAAAHERPRVQLQLGPASAAALGRTLIAQADKARAGAVG
ncbi:MAG TPA: hypothetical protein VGF50_01575 [Caulobacteraceae bacterium]|jgi:hypothetical protein